MPLRHPQALLGCRGPATRRSSGGPGAGPPPPPLTGEPLQPLLGVVELHGSHVPRAPRQLARVLEELVEHLAQRPVAAPLHHVALAFRAHAVWIPIARSSACWNSGHAARTVDATPCSPR